MAASLTVVICSLNGADRIDRPLNALDAQTARGELEIIVVDDGSSDGVGDVARARGLPVIAHEANQGLSAARNTGMRAATTPLVAFIDDDCEPTPDWAELLIGAYEDGVTGVGGPVVPITGTGFMSRYVERNNRHEPLELELTTSQALPYRLYLYLRNQWTTPQPKPRRDVYSFTGGNMSFRREELLEVGGFDERFRFGSEEEDLTRRLRRAGHDRMVFVPEAWITHRFEPTLRNVLRRSLQYGRGNALQYSKWPGVRPTLFPWPVLTFLLLAASLLLWPLVVVAVLLPLLLYPRGLKNATLGGAPEAFVDPFLQLTQEAYENVGFVRGALAFRGMEREPEPVRAGHPA
ncbi:glycosyltransferase [Actinomadura barringtoniae]|uniref:Glycosyltransferase n=1 Tax=Actinomadura barringtoniae TaxID=1427535 RepID=A0A939PDZ0_9ACTN|nr:glycosyltransferase family 2 protein [Actinomadura barringtoniae]MBO2446746.1 glycosyltransferase [Actinomadura barringtoniae]